jgi:hypothetical protein
MNEAGGWLFRFFEVGVLEDVGRSADEAEADTIAAGVALREAVAGDHDGLVSATVIALVQNLVDTGFRDGSPGTEDSAVRTALMATARTPALEFRTKAGRPFSCACSGCIRRGETRHVEVALRFE